MLGKIPMPRALHLDPFQARWLHNGSTPELLHDDKEGNREKYVVLFLPKVHEKSLMPDLYSMLSLIYLLSLGNFHPGRDRPV